MSFSSVTDFLNSKGIYVFEGYISQVEEQVIDLKNIINSVAEIKQESGSPIRAMEIGFNAGHSAEVFLSSNNNLTLVSFDLGGHEHFRVAKEYIDITYPGRHKLILGDSKTTIPNYIINNNATYPKENFDIIFIDGGHDYDTAKDDLLNCSQLAHPETIVLVDDTMFDDGWRMPWNVGPTSVWYDYVDKKIKELSRRDYYPGRGMAWGKYIF